MVGDASPNPVRVSGRDGGLVLARCGSRLVGDATDRPRTEIPPAQSTGCGSGIRDGDCTCYVGVQGSSADEALIDFVTKGGPSKGVLEVTRSTTWATAPLVDVFQQSFVVADVAQWRATGDADRGLQ